MRCVTAVAVGGLLGLGGSGQAAGEPIVKLFPSLVTRLSNALELPPSDTVPEELLTVQRATRVPFFRGPESPTASFSFRFDPDRGVPVPSAEGLGPFYAQRPDTVGRRHFSFGVTYTRVDFTELDGANLDALKITLPGPVAIDVSATVQVDAVNFQATYGLLDELDVAIAIPLVHQFVGLKGAMTTPFGTTSARISRDVTGLGDILLAAKYRFYDTERLALAARLEVSLPTGDDDDFLGFGTVQVSPALVASTNVGYGIVPHLNVGLHLSGDTAKLDHQAFYVAGVDWNIARSLTASLSVVGTHIIDNDRPKLLQSSGEGIRVRRSSSDIIDLGIGFKAVVWRRTVLVGGVLLPLNDTGLRAPVVMSAGVELPF